MIRKIPDFPKPGILFYDITSIMMNPDAFSRVIDMMVGIYKNKSILDSEEMVLFKKGIELCNEYYYYAKWTSLPIFFRNDGVFSIRFFFLETMVHGRTNYIQFDFDTFTQQVVDFNRGYGRIQP